MSEIIRSLGGSAAAPEKLRSDPNYWETNLNQALEAGKRLGELFITKNVKNDDEILQKLTKRFVNYFQSVLYLFRSGFLAVFALRTNLIALMQCTRNLQYFDVGIIAQFSSAECIY